MCVQYIWLYVKRDDVEDDDNDDYCVNTLQTINISNRWFGTIFFLKKEKHCLCSYLYAYICISMANALVHTNTCKHTVQNIESMYTHIQSHIDIRFNQTHHTVYVASVNGKRSYV